MKIDKIIDSDKIADVARRIKIAEEEVCMLTTEKVAADQKLNSAQCALSNLRLELSRAVDGHLDVDELKQPRRRMQEAS